MSAFQEKKSVCEPSPALSAGEIRFVGSGVAGSLDGVPDDLRRRLPDAVVDELLAGAKSEEEIVGPGGVPAQLTKRLVERALEVELTDHLGYEPAYRAAGRCGEHSDRVDAEDAGDGERAGRDQHAPGPQRQL